MNKPVEGNSRKPRRTRWMRRLAAIGGMLLAILLACSLFLQEGGKLFIRDRDGNIRFVLIERVFHKRPATPDTSSRPSGN